MITFFNKVLFNKILASVIEFNKIILGDSDMIINRTPKEEQFLLFEDSSSILFENEKEIIV